MTPEYDELADADGHIDCALALDRVYEFLDQEIDDASGDTIRRHLAECEPCLDRFDVEDAVKSLVNRCCSSETAPADLRAKVLGRLSAARDAAADQQA
ncbi:MAG: mycothiol system anti-sigma-R factor [Propionibacteriaceae bacterium]